jgi:hypothetical protein
LHTSHHSALLVLHALWRTEHLLIGSTDHEHSMHATTSIIARVHLTIMQSHFTLSLLAHVRTCAHTPTMLRPSPCGICTGKAGRGRAWLGWAGRRRSLHNRHPTSVGWWWGSTQNHTHTHTPAQHCALAAHPFTGPSTPHASPSTRGSREAAQSVGLACQSVSDSASQSDL